MFLPKEVGQWQQQCSMPQYLTSMSGILNCTYGFDIICGAQEALNKSFFL